MRARVEDGAAGRGVSSVLVMCSKKQNGFNLGRCLDVLIAYNYISCHAQTHRPVHTHTNIHTHTHTLTHIDVQAQVTHTHAQIRTRTHELTCSNTHVHTDAHLHPYTDS